MICRVKISDYIFILHIVVGIILPIYDCIEVQSHSI